MALQELFTDVQWGEAVGDAPGGWFRVSFQRPFTAVPGVSGIAYARTGSLPSRTVGAVSIPRLLAVKIPAPGTILAQKLSNIKIDRLDIGTPQDTIGNAMSNDCKTRLGDWGSLNWARDGICSVAYGVGYIAGAWIKWLWDKLVQPQVDKVENSINERISSVTDQINNAFSQFQVNINQVFSAQADRINAAIGTNLDNTNSAFAQFSRSLTDRVNVVLIDFYSATGIPLGIIISPIHVRNITPQGFEWQSFGNTRITWIAVGRGRTLRGGAILPGR